MAQTPGVNRFQSWSKKVEGQNVRSATNRDEVWCQIIRIPRGFSLEHNHVMTSFLAKQHGNIWLRQYDNRTCSLWSRQNDCYGMLWPTWVDRKPQIREKASACVVEMADGRWHTVQLAMGTKREVGVIMGHTRSCSSHRSLTLGCPQGQGREISPLVSDDT